MSEETKKGLAALFIIFAAFVMVDKLILNPPRYTRIGRKLF